MFSNSIIKMEDFCIELDRVRMLAILQRKKERKTTQLIKELKLSNLKKQLLIDRLACYYMSTIDFWNEDGTEREGLELFKEIVDASDDADSIEL